MGWRKGDTRGGKGKRKSGKKENDEVKNKGGQIFQQKEYELLQAVV